MANLAIVPVKPFIEGKSRLRTIFSINRLEEINRNCFYRTLKTIKLCSKIDRILVVSKDKTVLNEAKSLGAETLHEDEPYSLNNAVAQGLIRAGDLKAKKVLIIPTDLPKLTSEDLEIFCCTANLAPSIRIVPDRNQTGTNAVFLNNVKGFIPQFGQNSFQKHAKQALMLTGNLEIKLIKNIQHDLDTVVDLDLLDENIVIQLNLNERKEH